MNILQKKLITMLICVLVTLTNVIYSFFYPYRETRKDQTNNNLSGKQIFL